MAESNALPNHSGAVAKSLGYLGALPAWMAIAAIAVDADAAVRFLCVYVASIFAFLGGIQWGFGCVAAEEKTRRRRLAVSVWPSLLATTALLIEPGPGLAILVVGLAALLAYEHAERSDPSVPDWYLPLRRRLSALVVAGCGVALAVLIV